MKKILPLITIGLFMQTAYSEEGFNDMSIDEIYRRGYALEVTVAEATGVVIKSGEEIVLLGIESDRCYLKVRSAPSEKSRISKGRSFKLTTHSVGFKGNSSAHDGLYADSSSKIIGLDYAGGSESALSSVRKWCSKLDFKVIEANLPEY